MTLGGIVLQNLVYVIGALLGIVVGAVAVTLRHRRPTSVEANMALFHKGLAALAPDAEPVRRHQPPPPAVRAAPRAQTAYLVVTGRGSEPAGGPAVVPEPVERTSTEAETG